MSEDQINIPSPPTQKGQKTGPHRFTPQGERKEARRLFKSLKVGLLKEEDLTPYGRDLVVRYYPFVLQSNFDKEGHDFPL